jgi:hypothetical protein
LCLRAFKVQTRREKVLGIGGFSSGRIVDAKARTTCGAEGLSGKDSLHIFLLVCFLACFLDCFAY